MKVVVVLLLAGALSVGAFYRCTGNAKTSCVEDLRARDARLQSQADSLINVQNATAPDAYRKALTALQAEEELLFRDARQCDFGENLTEYNYWFRGRLKFPSTIEQELNRLNGDDVRQ
jgi:hypothetical protein